MRYYFTVLFALFVALPAIAQNSDADRVFFDAIAFAGNTSDSTMLDVYLAIPYGGLEFERDGGRFSARYQAHVLVRSGGRTWLDTTYARTAITSSYDVSSGAAPAFDIYQERLVLPPGTYDASVELLDLRSNRVSTTRRTATTVDHDAFPFSLSGLMLVSKIREDSSGFVITPLFTENVSRAEGGYFLFFEVYNRSEREQFRIDAIYGTPDGSTVQKHSFEKNLPKGRSQQWIRLPNEGIAKGVYVIELKVHAQGDSLRSLAASQRTVRFEGGAFGMPISEGELEEKVTQLRYVATQTEIDRIRDGGPFSEQRKRFAEFWERLDPTPGTPQNEAMDEYYGRIAFANERYRSYAAGWLTDKGRVYVIYGPPDNVTADAFRSDGKAVETWQYYSRSLRLIFVDENGFGDFRLATAIPPGEKYRYGG